MVVDACAMLNASDGHEFSSRVQDFCAVRTVLEGFTS